MTMQDTVRHVAARLDLSQNQVRSVLDTLAAYVEEALGRGEKVTLPGVGTLEGKWREPRVVRSIADARRTFVGGRYVVKYVPAAGIKRVLEGRAPKVWRSPEHQAAWRLAETLIGDLALYHAARAPTDLPADAAPAVVEERCAAAFGDLWTRVRAEWREKVPPSVGADHDYLGRAAVARWGHG